MYQHLLQFLLQSKQKADVKEKVTINNKQVFRTTLSSLNDTNYNDPKQVNGKLLLKQLYKERLIFLCIPGDRGHPLTPKHLIG